MVDTFTDMRNMADIARNIELQEVLRHCGCIQSSTDKSKWLTPRGKISVAGQKFMNWSQGTGGGGAIDLIIHLKGYDFKKAVCRLLENFSPSDSQMFKEPIHPSQHIFILPQRDDSKFPRVKHYLEYTRCIPPELINRLFLSGILYADYRGNAVFLLLGKEKKAVGAELRGTTKSQWRGMAPGSRKKLGCFYVKNSTTQKIVLCESAIDALSCYTLDPNCTSISTSGAHPNPAWLSKLIGKGFEIYCGFDSDETGEIHAKKMINRFPEIKRLRPQKHDWNEVLQSIHHQRLTT